MIDTTYNDFKIHNITIIFVIVHNHLKIMFQIFYFQFRNKSKPISQNHIFINGYSLFFSNSIKFFDIFAIFCFCLGIQKSGSG